MRVILTVGSRITQIVVDFQFLEEFFWTYLKDLNKMVLTCVFLGKKFSTALSLSFCCFYRKIQFCSR